MNKVHLELACRPLVGQCIPSLIQWSGEDFPQRTIFFRKHVLSKPALFIVGHHHSIRSSAAFTPEIWRSAGIRVYPCQPWDMLITITVDVRKLQFSLVSGTDGHPVTLPDVLSLLCLSQFLHISFPHWLPSLWSNTSTGIVPPHWHWGTVPTTVTAGEADPMRDISALCTTYSAHFAVA